MLKFLIITISLFSLNSWGSGTTCANYACVDSDVIGAVWDDLVSDNPQYKIELILSSYFSMGDLEDQNGIKIERTKNKENLEVLRVNYEKVYSKFFQSMALRAIETRIDNYAKNCPFYKEQSKPWGIIKKQLGFYPRSFYDNVQQLSMSTLSEKYVQKKLQEINKICNKDLPNPIEIKDYEYFRGTRSQIMKIKGSR